MNTRRVLSVSLVLFLAASVAPTVRGQTNGKESPPNAKAPELQEIFRLPLPDGESLQERLLKGTNGALDGIVARNHGQLEVLLNCERVKQLAIQANQNADPILLDALLLPNLGRKPHLRYDAFNPTRETNLLELVGKEPGGKLLRVFYHYDMKYREDTYIAQRLEALEQVSIEDIRRLGKTTPSATVEDVHFDVGFGDKPFPIPKLSPLAAAVGDRSGRTSNFILVQEVQIDPTTGKIIDGDK